MGSTSMMSSVNGDDNTSVVSENISVFSGKLTHAEKNLNRLDANRGRELETVKNNLLEAEMQI